MKKYNLLLIPLIALISLSSCDKKDDDTSNNNEPVNITNVDQAIEGINKLHSHPNEIRANQVFTSSNLTSNNTTFKMKMSVVGDTHHYEYNDKHITRIENTQGSLEDDGSVSSPSNIVQEFSYDESYMYQITVSNDPLIDNGCLKFRYDENIVDYFMKTNYEAMTLANLNVFKSELDNPLFKCEISGTPFVTNGEWKLNYKMVNYEQEAKVIKQVVSYQVTMTIQDSIITKVSEHQENVGYAGGKAVQSMITDSRYAFIEGEYKAYPGKPLDPKNY